MSYLRSRLKYEIKTPAIIFIASFLIIGAFALTMGGVDLKSIDLISSILIFANIIAVVSSFVHFYKCLDIRLNKFNFQGIGTRFEKFIYPLIGEYIVYIVLDILILTLMVWSGSISDIFSSYSVGVENEVNLTYALFNTMIFKYLLSIIIFFVYNISYNKIICVVIIASFGINFSYASTILYSNPLFTLLLIVVLFVLSWYIMIIKTTKKDKSKIIMFNIGVITTLAILYFYLLFFTKIYATSIPTLVIGENVIRIETFVLTLGVVLFASIIAYKKVNAKIAIPFTFVLPFVLASALHYYDVNIQDSMQYNEYHKEYDSKNTYILGYCISDYDIACEYGSKPTDDSKNMNFSDISNKQRDSMKKDLLSKKVYSVSYPFIEKVNGTNLLDRDEMYLNLENEENDKIILKKQDFISIIKKYGYSISSKYAINIDEYKKTKDDSGGEVYDSATLAYVEVHESEYSKNLVQSSSEEEEIGFYEYDEEGNEVKASYPTKNIVSKDILDKISKMHEKYNDTENTSKEYKSIQVQNIQTVSYKGKGLFNLSVEKNVSPDKVNTNNTAFVTFEKKENIKKIYEYLGLKEES